MTSPALPSPPQATGLLAAPPPLFVREAGTGAPLVMLHGLASSSRYWEPHVPVVSRTHRVLAPDLLGFGRSPKPADAAYTPAEHVTALAAALLSRLSEPATFVGHSMGTIVALHFAVSYPELVRRLMLVSLPVIGGGAWGHLPDGGARGFHHFAVHSRAGQALFGAGMRAVAPVGQVVWPRFRRDIPRGAAQDALRTTWAAYWRTLEATVYGSDVPGLFTAARPPLLVMHGPRDIVVPVGPVRELVGTRPDVRYVEVPGAGHNPAFTQMQLFYDTLAEFEGFG